LYAVENSLNNHLQKEYFTITKGFQRQIYKPGNTQAGKLKFM